VRVSTERQAGEGVSLMAQAAKVRAMAEVQDAALLRIIEDAGASGKSLQRPGLAELLKAVEARSVDVVIVFTTRLGGVLDPRNVLRAFHALLTSAVITPRRRFHDLRHSAASLLLAQGVHLAEVSMLLGHAELRTTSDLYGHLEADSSSCGYEDGCRAAAGGQPLRVSRGCQRAGPATTTPLKTL
jgi:site-specific recombinase XerC